MRKGSFRTPKGFVWGCERVRFAKRGWFSCFFIPFLPLGISISRISFVKILHFSKWIIIHFDMGWRKIITITTPRHHRHVARRVGLAWRFRPAEPTVAYIKYASVTSNVGWTIILFKLFFQKCKFKFIKIYSYFSTNLPNFAFKNHFYLRVILIDFKLLFSTKNNNLMVISYEWIKLKKSGKSVLLIWNRRLGASSK